MAYRPPTIGEMKHRPTIEVEHRQPNGRGGWVTGWVALATVWAKMLPLRGDEALEAGIQRSTQLWRVTIRYRDDVAPKNRLRIGERTFNIVSAADPTGGRAWLDIAAEEGVAT